MSGKLKIKATPAGDAAATKAAASRARGHKPFGASEAKLHRPRYASALGDLRKRSTFAPKRLRAFGQRLAFGFGALACRIGLAVGASGFRCVFRLAIWRT